MSCPFCELPRERIVDEDALTLTIRDAFPVSPGHTLVLPRRHFASFFDASDAERRAIFDSLRGARDALERELHPEARPCG